MKKKKANKGPNIWDKGPWIAFDEAEPTPDQSVVLADPLDGSPGKGQTVQVHWPVPESSTWVRLILHDRVRYWRPADLDWHPKRGWILRPAGPR